MTHRDGKKNIPSKVKKQNVYLFQGENTFQTHTIKVLKEAPFHFSELV